MASTIKKPSDNRSSDRRRAVGKPAGEGFRTVSSPALEFCREHNLKPYIDIAGRLLGELFTSSGYARVTKEEDPEFDEQWVTIFIRVSGDVDRIAAAYDQYIKRWTAQVPADVVGKIRLSIGAA